ncbi:MAG TPA: sigma factor-like helix-turn-helix DNA-binding protein [Solirubrobacteraceae bacterium]|jgi:hypothetical protein|nr:sigma factor-like helix-turn-helix DNA-binding protein [Solirubrobacteraceae bacterium]
MTEPDRLPPDQRAVLSLVLDRGKSYAQVAAMLSIPEATVRERAHAALDTLATSADASAATIAAGESRVSDTFASGPPASAGGPSVRSAQSSRLGGAVLLAGIVVAIIVAVVLLTGGGKGGSSKGSTTSASSTTGTSSTSTSASGSAKPRIDKKLALSPVEPESHATGEGYVLSDGSRRAFYIAAKGLEPSHGFFYAVWLYNSPSSSAPLGRAPSVGSNGRLEGGGPLPSNATNYGKLIVTRETSTHARQPGTIVLSGAFALH